MTETFSYCTRVGASGDISQRTWENDYGDGYIQAGGIGINTKSQSWEISITGRMASGSDLMDARDFLDRHEGYKSFHWSAPGSGIGLYSSNGYKLSAAGAGIFTLTATFKQTYRP